LISVPLKVLPPRPRMIISVIRSVLLVASSTRWRDFKIRALECI
jgi:hypothetical protein